MHISLWYTGCPSRETCTLFSSQDSTTAMYPIGAALEDQSEASTGPECNYIVSKHVGNGRVCLSIPTLCPLHKLYWLPIRFHVRSKVLVIPNKDLHGTGPDYLRDCLSVVVSARPVQAQQSGHALDPFHSTVSSIWIYKAQPIYCN